MCRITLYTRIITSTFSGKAEVDITMTHVVLMQQTFGLQLLTEALVQVVLEDANFYLPSKLHELTQLIQTSLIHHTNFISFMLFVFKEMVGVLSNFYPKK